MSNYFRRLPDLDYVSRLEEAKLSDYIQVKNIFRRAYIREDIFQDTMYFTKYKIQGNDRPDNVANQIYDDPTLDWLVLISNNILNVQSEWPLSNDDFDEYLLEKYESYENLNAIHHYESVEIKNNSGVTVFPAGMWVDKDYRITYLEEDTGQVVKRNPVVEVTNYDYETKIENKKRNIFVIKPEYVQLVLDDITRIMKYEKGSAQYVSKSLKRGDNIKLFS